MKWLSRLLPILALCAALGCEKSDLNKDLKPVDTKATGLKPGGAGDGANAGGGGTREKAPAILK